MNFWTEIVFDGVTNFDLQAKSLAGEVEEDCLASSSG